MANVMKLINGSLRTVKIGHEEPIPKGAISIDIVFPTELHNKNNEPIIKASMVNTGDSKISAQHVEVKNRSSKGFTAVWKNKVPNDDFRLSYIVPDGFIS